VSVQPFTATLRHDEAVLRFPFDEGLRQLLRAIPGRRWDPADRTWCVPLGAEQAEALSRLLDGLPHAPDVEEQLSRALQRRRARRPRGECLVELCRPDSDWWLSFPTDAPPEPVTALLGHPGARELEAIGRAHVPLDERAVELLASLRRDGAQIRLSEQAERAIRQASGEAVEEGDDGRPAAPQPGQVGGLHDVEFRRDRRGDHWVLIGARGAALARVLAARSGLVPYEGPAGSLGLAARESGAGAIAELLSHLEDLDIDPRVEAWLARATSWRGTIDVQGPR
jgi:hypothetical protein